MKERGDHADDAGFIERLVQALFPDWFAGFAFAAIAIGAWVPAAVMSIGSANLFTRNFWKAYVNPEIDPAPALFVGWPWEWLEARTWRGRMASNRCTL